MPTYGYKCTSCNHTFEVLQKVSDEPVKTCEKCNKEVKKILYPVGIMFKGSGFHVNDYGKKEPGSKKDAAPESKTKGTSSAENKSGD